MIPSWVIGGAAAWTIYALTGSVLLSVVGGGIYLCMWFLTAGEEW